MNPWGLLALALGVVLIIIGVKGTQHDIAATIVGRTKNANSQSSSPSNTTTTSSAL